MNIKSKIVSFLFVFVMALGFMPSTMVHASVKDINIISETEATASNAKKWAKTKGATEEFLSLADLYWKYSETCGDVNPAIAYVQSAKETGFGRFGGVLDSSFRNPCGMKTSQGGSDGDKNAHKKFNTWDEGVQAHMDHLALYAGANGYPKSDTYDPRHFISIKGKSPTVNSLGGKWAPSLTYGEEVNKYYIELCNYSNIAVNKDEQKDYEDNLNDNDDNDSSHFSPPGPVENKPNSLITDSVIMFDNSFVEPTLNRETNVSSDIGWKEEDGKWYYYYSDESKAAGWINPNGNWYYLNSTGEMSVGWTDLDNSWYYFDDDGIMVTGWKCIDNNWYYLKTSGIMATGFLQNANDLYYLDKSGVMLSKEGWNLIDEKWCYVENSGNLKLGWLLDNGNKYYLQGDGSMVTGIKLIDNKTYVFDQNGINKTGWTNINNYWYYFNENSEMSTGWLNLNGTHYYLYDTGAMATGWLSIDDDWYHFNNDGSRSLGWVQSGGYYYYLDLQSGKLLKNTKVDGYEIDSNGRRKSDKNDVISGNTSNNVIVVDAGHNFGGDDGAYATNNGITYSERDLNMEVAVKLKSELENRGYTVAMTRNESDRETLAAMQSLDKRVKLANDLNATLFVSIHHNSADAVSANGVEVFYSTNAQDDRMGGKSPNQLRIEKSKAMATSIVNNICSKTGAINRGPKDGNLNVCRNTNMPAILIECGFITNANEAARCADSNNQTIVAKAIAEAIQNQLN
ncbi:cell wall hydrolase [Clostridium botulinum]|uniref:N-acetylmuramoyl-L-alanine amidase n=1 Tax=Clostridium sp. CH2 TaxID=2949990 RepID=UPI0013FCD25F|nr:N-acetylmuramoyl-L-alanine amidase [Clostridium sp. CH2]NFT06123.1 cell wall hydrolase [Clostridium botulinum]